MPPAPSPPAASMVRGQRWMSDAEPELGLGTVVSTDARSVVLSFAATGQTRRYALGSAPLRRVRFVVGDSVVDRGGSRHRIDEVHERAHLIVYRCAGVEIPEESVSAQAALGSPAQRLAAGRVDPPAAFELRMETAARLHDVRSSPLRGFVGPRVELLPHQFFIASQVAGRLTPRVLLADETGLGKTIEAGLVLSRLLLTGRAARVLVLVPESLVHQWLVELRRRFQLRFALFDEQRCAGIERAEAADNPFVQEQLVLAGLPLLADSPLRCEQAAEAGWDVVVVDEAHHLEWTRHGSSANYRAVEAIAARAGGLMLLTATPQQLGEEGHFARLRLLDPDRYADFERWLAEADDYRQVAAVARELIAGRVPDADGMERLARFLDTDRAVVARRCAEASGRDRLLAELIDRHGPGRVMFRNTRAAVGGFGERDVDRITLEPAVSGDASAALAGRLHEELAADLRRETSALWPQAGATDEAQGFADAPPPAPAPRAAAPACDFDGDPRIDWLVSLLSRPQPAKVLTICRSAAKAQAIKTALERRINVSTALFHEDLTLVQRDRNAAWFADPAGARLLLCSELGSEGRNFQHAQHLVMFDLPLDPDLVEQRIGRLDRIGQRGRVHVHVPVVAGSGLEVLARWHEEGAGTLRRPTLVGQALLQRFGARLAHLAARAGNAQAATEGECLEADVRRLLAETAAAAGELTAAVEEGRDRLLEMASLRRPLAAALVDAVRERDRDDSLDDYMLRLLEHFGIYAEELRERTYLLNPDAGASPQFPGLESGETAVTCDRELALAREDLQFMTCDHPLLGDAMELLLASESGNAVFAIAAGDEGEPPRLLLDAAFVLEAVAPPRLHADRFLAPTPVRVVVDQHLAEAGADVFAGAALRAGRGQWIAEKRSVLAPLLERMRTRCEQLAEERAVAERTRAREAMRAQLDDELNRLRALAAINDNVRADEAALLEREREELAGAIDGARLRPDALRLVWQGPARDGVPVTAPRAAAGKTAVRGGAGAATHRNRNPVRPS